MDVHSTVRIALQAEKLQDFHRIYDLWLSLIAYLKQRPNVRNTIGLHSVPCAKKGHQSLWSMLVRHLNAPHSGVRRASLYLLTVIFNHHPNVQEYVISNPKRCLQFRWREFWICHIPRETVMNWEERRCRLHLDKSFDIQFSETVVELGKAQDRKVTLRKVPGDFLHHGNMSSQKYLGKFGKDDPLEWFEPTENDVIAELEEHLNPPKEEEDEDSILGHFNKLNSEVPTNQPQLFIHKHTVKPFELLKVGAPIALQTYLLWASSHTYDEVGKVARLTFSKSSSLLPSRNTQYVPRSKDANLSKVENDINDNLQFDPWVYFEMDRAVIPKLAYFIQSALSSLESITGSRRNHGSHITTPMRERRTPLVSLVLNSLQHRGGYVSLYQFLSFFRKSPLSVPPGEVNDYELSLVFDYILSNHQGMVEDETLGVGMELGVGLVDSVASSVRTSRTSGGLNRAGSIGGTTVASTAFNSQGKPGGANPGEFSLQAFILFLEAITNSRIRTSNHFSHQHGSRMSSEQHEAESWNISAKCYYTYEPIRSDLHDVLSHRIADLTRKLKKHFNVEDVENIHPEVPSNTTESGKAKRSIQFIGKAKDSEYQATYGTNNGAEFGWHKTISSGKDNADKCSYLIWPPPPITGDVDPSVSRRDSLRDSVYSTMSPLAAELSQSHSFGGRGSFSARSSSRPQSLHEGGFNIEEAIADGEREILHIPDPKNRIIGFKLDDSLLNMSHEHEIYLDENPLSAFSVDNARKINNNNLTPTSKVNNSFSVPVSPSVQASQGPKTPTGSALKGIDRSPSMKRVAMSPAATSSHTSIPFPTSLPTPTGSMKGRAARSSNSDRLFLDYLSEPPSYHWFEKCLQISKYPKQIQSRSVLLFSLRKMFLKAMVEQNEDDAVTSHESFNLDEGDEDETNLNENHSIDKSAVLKPPSWSLYVEGARLFKTHVFHHWFNKARKLLTDFDFEAHENHTFEDDADEREEISVQDDDLQDLYYDNSASGVQKTRKELDTENKEHEPSNASEHKGKQLNVAKQTFKILLRSMSEFRKQVKSSKYTERAATVHSKTSKKEKKAPKKYKSLPRISWYGIMKLEETLYVAQRIYNETHQIEETIEDGSVEVDVESGTVKKNSRAVNLWAKLRSMVLGGFVSRAHELEIKSRKKTEMCKLMNVFFSNWRCLNSFRRIPNALSIAQPISKDENKLHEITMYNGLILMNTAKSCTLSTNTTNNSGGFLNGDELGHSIVEVVLGRLASDAAITAATKMKFKDDETMSVMKAEIVRYADIISKRTSEASRIFQESDLIDQKKFKNPVEGVPSPHDEDEHYEDDFPEYDANEAVRGDVYDSRNHSEKQRSPVSSDGHGKHLDSSHDQDKCRKVPVQLNISLLVPRNIFTYSSDDDQMHVFSENENDFQLVLKVHPLKPNKDFHQKIARAVRNAKLNTKSMNDEAHLTYEQRKANKSIANHRKAAQSSSFGQWAVGMRAIEPPGKDDRRKADEKADSYNIQQAHSYGLNEDIWANADKSISEIEKCLGSKFITSGANVSQGKTSDILKDAKTPTSADDHMPCLFEISIPLSKLKQEVMNMNQSHSRRRGNGPRSRHSERNKGLLNKKGEIEINHEKEVEIINKLTVSLFPFDVDENKHKKYNLGAEVRKTVDKLVVILNQRMAEDTNIVDVISDELVLKICDKFMLPLNIIEQYIEKYGLDIFNCDVYRHLDESIGFLKGSSPLSSPLSPSWVDGQLKKDFQSDQVPKMPYAQEKLSLILPINIPQSHPMLTLLFSKKLLEPYLRKLKEAYDFIVWKQQERGKHPKHQNMLNLKAKASNMFSLSQNMMNTHSSNVISTHQLEHNTESEHTNIDVTMFSSSALKQLVEETRQLLEQVIICLNTEIASIRKEGTEKPQGGENHSSKGKAEVKTTATNNDNVLAEGFGIAGTVTKATALMKPGVLNEAKTKFDSTLNNSIHQEDAAAMGGTVSSIRFLQSIHEKKRLSNPLLLLRDKLKKCLRKLRIMSMITEVCSANVSDPTEKGAVESKSSRSSKALQQKYKAKFSSWMNTLLHDSDSHSQKSLTENSVVLLKLYLQKIFEVELNLTNWPNLTDKHHILSYQDNAIGENGNVKDDEIESVLLYLRGKKKQADEGLASMSLKQQGSLDRDNMSQFRVKLGSFAEDDRVIKSSSLVDPNNAMKVSTNNESMAFSKNKAESTHKGNNKDRAQQERHILAADLTIMAELGAELQVANHQRKKEHVAYKVNYRDRRDRIKPRHGS